MEYFKEIALPCLYTFIACCAFGIQFNIRFGHLIAASVGSIVSQLVYSLLQMSEFNEIACCFIAAAAVAAYSEVMARCFKAPVNMYLIVGIIPLVPGGLIYYTMLALVMGDNETFLDRAVDAFSAAGSIAMGIFAVSSAVRLAVDFYRHYENKKMSGAQHFKHNHDIKKL